MYWIPIVIILLIVIAILSAYLIIIKIQIKKLSAMLNFIDTNDTNMQLYTGVKMTEIVDLAKQINSIISHYKTDGIRLQQIEREFKQVVTNLSHDLRTPLTSVAGYIQMLKSDKTPTDKKAEYIDTIDDRIGTLREMLNTLFEFSRLQSNEYNFEMQQLNICSLLCDTLSSYYEDFMARGISPKIKLIQEKISIYADKYALKRVFENLISNTLKHSDGDLRVEVLTDSEKVMVIFENVTNNLTEEDIKQIFNRFFIGDKSRSNKNTGLGLAIAKELVHKMDGEITAQLDKDVLKIIVIFKKFNQGT